MLDATAGNRKAAGRHCSSSSRLRPRKRRGCLRRMSSGRRRKRPPPQIPSLAPSVAGKHTARGCRAHRQRAESGGRTDYRQVDVAAGAERILQALSKRVVARQVCRRHGLPGARAERSAALGHEDPHGAGRPVVPALSAHGARRGAAMRARSGTRHQRTRHRSRQRNSRRHRRAADASGAQRGEPRH